MESAWLELEDAEAGTVELLFPYQQSVSEGVGATFVTVRARVGTERATETTVTVEVRGSGRPAAVGFEPVDPFGVKIPPGERSADGGFMLQPLDDERDGPDETIAVSGRASPAGLRVTGATLTLADDDHPPSESVALTLSETELEEYAVGAYVTVTATLEGTALERDAAVTLTAAGSGVEGEVGSGLRYGGIVLPIPAGSVSGERTFWVQTSEGFGIDERDGTLTVTGTAPGLEVAAATLALRDGDDPPDRVVLSLNETSVSKSAGGWITVYGELVPSGRVDATVVTVTGTGAKGVVGFEPVELTIPGRRRLFGASFEIVPERDREAEGDETLTLSGTTDVPGLEVVPARLTLVDEGY